MVAERILTQPKTTTAKQFVSRYYSVLLEIRVALANCRLRLVTRVLQELQINSAIGGNYARNDHAMRESSGHIIIP